MYSNTITGNPRTPDITFFLRRLYTANGPVRLRPTP